MIHACRTPRTTEASANDWTCPGCHLSWWWCRGEWWPGEYEPPTWVSVMGARIVRMNQLILEDSGPAPVPCQVHDEDGRQCTLIQHDPKYAHRIEIEVEPDE